jgi:hypothetical protein
MFQAVKLRKRVSAMTPVRMRKTIPPSTSWQSDSQPDRLEFDKLARCLRFANLSVEQGLQSHETTRVGHTVQADDLSHCEGGIMATGWF